LLPLLKVAAELNDAQAWKEEEERDAPI